MDDVLNSPIIVVATPKGAKKLADNSRTMLSKINSKKSFWLGAALTPFGMKLALSGAVLSELIDRFGILADESEEKEDNLDEIADTLQELLSLGHTPTIIDPSNARERYHFPEGYMPPDGTLMVAHPILEDSYLLPQSYEVTLAKEKTAVFRRLLASLGAKSVKLAHASYESDSWTSSFTGKKGLGEKAAAQANIRANINKDGSVEKEETANFGKPKVNPHVPEDIEPWVNWDSSLRTLAKQRIDQNLLTTKFSASYEDMSSGYGSGTFQLMSGTNTGDMKSGYEKMISSHWTYEIEFWDKDELPE